MTTTVPPAVLGRMSDELVAKVYHHEGTSDALRDALTAEMERRDAARDRAREAQRKADERRAERRIARAEAIETAIAAAEAATNGYMLNAAGQREMAAGRLTERTLFTGRSDWARKYASAELLAHWETHPRPTEAMHAGFDGRLGHEGQRSRRPVSESAAWRDAQEEARYDQLGGHARNAIRRAESPRPEGDRVRGDSRGHDVPRPHAAGSAPGPQAGEAGGRTTGPGGFVQRGGRDVNAACVHLGRAPADRCDDCPLRVRGNVATTTSSAAEQVALLNSMTEQIRARAALRATHAPPVVSGALSPAPGAVRPAGTGMAVREGVVVSAARPHIDGDTVARYIYTALKRFAVWNSEAEIVTATAWVMQAHAKDPDTGQPAWQYSPRLGIFGPSGSGKSWKARLVCKLSPKGEILLEPTKASFLDMCADNQTIAITEADELFYTAGKARGILAAVNAGYEPDRKASRKHGGKTLKIPVFTPIVLDGLNTMLEATRSDLRTMISRCIVILANTAPEGYRPPRFDRQARASFEQVSQLTAAWAAQEIAAGMGDTVPYVPEHLGNRPFALWEPLFTVMQHVDGGDSDGMWSTAIREACEALESGAGLPEPEPDQGDTELDRTMAAWGEEW